MKKKSKLEKFTPFVLGTAMLTMVAACGSDSDDNDSSPQQSEEQQQEGQYRVVLTPVNTNVAGEITGSGDFLIEGDNFQATVNVDGAPSAIHMQHIHAGSRCAGPEADTNADGFVDAVEASAVSGGALIPLDSDLRSQSAGGVYPIGANYDYTESTSFLAMIADLRLPDTDTTDDLVKLGADEPLNLAGRVVEIHGVPSSTTLPPTVQGIGDASPQQSLPIACGVITRADTPTTTGGTGGTGTTTGETGTTTGETGTTTGETGTTTGETGTTTGETGTTTGETGTTGGTGTTTGGVTGL